MYFIHYRFPSFLRPAGGSLSAAGGPNQMFPQFSFLNPAGLGWPSTSSNLFSSNQHPLSTEKVIPTAQPPVSTTSLGSIPFSPHFRQPHDNQNSTGTENSFVSFLPPSNHTSLAQPSEMFPFLKNNASNKSRSIFDFFPKDQLDYRMDNKNLTSPNVSQGIFKTWSFGVSPTGNRTAGKFFEHVYTDLRNKSDSFSTNITVFGPRPSEIKDNPNNIRSSAQFSHHGNLDKGDPTNKTQGSPFQTMFQELMLPSSVPNSSKHFVNLPDGIRNRIEAMNSEMLIDKLKQSHIPSSGHISHLDVNANKGNNPDNEVENIFKRLDLPMFKRKHLKLPSLEIQDRLRQLVNKWMRNQESDTNHNISAFNTPKEAKVSSEINIPKERKVLPEVNIPKETKLKPEVNILKVTNGPPEVNTPKETKVQLELNVPKETRIPSELNAPKETKIPSELPSNTINIHKEAIIPQEFINKTRRTDNLKMPAIGGKTSENGEIDMIIQLSKEPTRKSIEISKKTTIVPGSEQWISKADRRNDIKWSKLTMGISTSTPIHLNFDTTNVTAYPDTTRKKEMRENNVSPDLKVKSNKTDFPYRGMVENTFYQPDKTQKLTDLRKTLPINSAALPDIKAKNFKEHTPLYTYPEINEFEKPKNVVSILAATEKKSEHSITSSKNDDKKHTVGINSLSTNTVEENYNITTLGQTNVITKLTENFNLHNATRPEKDTERTKAKEHVGPEGLDINLINFQMDKQRVTSGKIISDTPFYSVTETKLPNKNKAAMPITTPVMHYNSTRGTDLQRDETLKRNTFLMPTFTTNNRGIAKKMQTQIVTLPPVATPPPIVMPPPIATPPPIVMPPPVATPPPIVMPPQIYNIKHGGFQFNTALSDMNGLGNRKQFIGNEGDDYIGNINVTPKESIFNKNSEKQKSKLNTESNKIESKQGTHIYFPDILRSIDKHEPVKPSKSKRVEWDRQTSFENTRQKTPPKVTGLLEQMLAGSSRNTVDLFKLPSKPKYREKNKTKKLPTVKKQIFPEVLRNDNNRADLKESGQKSRSLPISILEMFYNGFSKKKTKETLTPHIPEISNIHVQEKAVLTSLPQKDNSDTFLNKMVQDPYKSEMKSFMKAPAYQNNKHSTVKYNEYASLKTSDDGVNVGSEPRRTEPVMNKKKLILSQPNRNVNDRTRLGINILNYLLSF